MERTIILASASPRRKELMEQAGFSFTVCPGCGEETITKTAPAEIVEELSLQKAEEIARTYKNDAPDHTLIIGADTIVTLDGMVMGKPRDEEDAFRMLLKLQNNIHQVYTGVTLIYFKNGGIKQKSFSERTDVSVYPMSEAEIRSYITTKEPMDKAGSYGIQGLFAIYIEKINGDYNNVVGLPIARLYHEIKNL